MVHVCYGLYDKDGRYSKFVGTSMASIFENTSTNVIVHIFHDNTLTADNHDKFNEIAKKYNQQVKFYNVEVLAADRINNIKKSLPHLLMSRYSIATIYRLLIPEILDNINKIIYLDADIIVNLDIDKLWSVDIKDYPLAAVPEVSVCINWSKDESKYLLKNNLVSDKDYFNAGVLILNIEYFRKNEDEINEGYKFICQHPQCLFFDQDLLNYCFSNKYIKLEPQFQRFTSYERSLHNHCFEAIYHFAGNSLTLEANDEFNHMYLNYFVKTPWCNADTFDHIRNIISEIRNQSKTEMLQMTKIMAGKMRSFFTEFQIVGNIKNIFEIKPNEEIFINNTPPDYQHLIDNMNENRDKKVFFILVADYNSVCKTLLQNNFIENVDFIDATVFFSEKHGIQFNTNFIIKAM